MRKLSEFKDDEALELLADLLEPCTNLVSDGEFTAGYKNPKTRVKTLSNVLKNHKNDIVTILARMNETPVEEYHYNVGSLMSDFFTLMTDQDFMAFFGLSAPQAKKRKKPSGSATANTAEKE